jgi:hypothetical protein
LALKAGTAFTIADLASILYAVGVFCEVLHRSTGVQSARDDVCYWLIKNLRYLPGHTVAPK